MQFNALIYLGCFFWIIIIIIFCIRFKWLNDIFSNQKACLINFIHKTLTI